MNIRIVIFYVLLIFTQNLLICQDYIEKQKLVSPERNIGGGFGINHFLSDQFAIIGEVGKFKILVSGDTLFDVGAAYIYKRDFLNNWIFDQKLEAPDGSNLDYFGYSVSIFQDYIAVGALQDDDAGNNTILGNGSVYIFKKNNLNIWEFSQKISPPEKNYPHSFGRKLSIHDNYLAISAPLDWTDEMDSNPLQNAGAVYIYKKDDSDKWIYFQKIVSSSRTFNYMFGTSLSMDSNKIVIGEPNYRIDSSKPRTGAAYIFELDNNGAWTEIQKLTAEIQENDSAFGFSTALFDKTIIIGGYLTDRNENEQDNLTNAGAIYVFEQQGNGNWTQSQKLVASDRKENSHFGFSCSIFKKEIIVGAYYESNDKNNANSINWAGAAYIFERHLDGNWLEKQKVVASDRTANSYFGHSVAINTDEILVGATLNSYDENGENHIKSAGAAYFFDKCTNTYFTDTQSSCDQLTWLDGITYTSNNNTAQYKITNTLGCDSIITLNLTIFPSQNITETQTACNSYFWNNQTYTESGSYTYQTINADGCDSIATLDLIIFKSSDENISHIACDAYFWNNQTYTQSGLYTFQTTNQYGCDSIISLDLTVNPSYQETITYTTCEDYTWNGQTYNQSGVYTYATTNQFGCDSILTLDLTINNTILTNETQTACDVYFWNNQTYTQSGLYTFQTINADGCDSIATLDLTIFQASDENTSYTACDSYFWNNQTYTQSGLYTFQTTNQYGCDSVISLDLIVNPSYQQTITHTTCDDYTWNGQTYYQSGVYTYATTNQFGCDSILTLDLTINNTILTNEAQTACDVYFWNNETYTQSGSYTYQTINADGCDSIANLELIIFESNSNNIFQSACQSFEYENQILTESGIYTFNLQNSFGCDSIVTLELEILDQFTSQSVSSCDQYIWPANGQMYLQSGVYTDSLQNIFGCDSVMQLDLNISPSFNIPDQEEVCDQYLWSPNNTTYTQSGFYQLDLKTTQGCDSILTLDLTVQPSFIQIDTVISTTEYTWQINNTTYATSGIYTEKWLTPVDCDSIHQLLLTIKTDSDIYFPNIILPNSQNSNFTIFGSNSIDLIQSLSIYDRWSNLVFHQENFPPNQASLGWNGKFRGQPVIPGVYVWTAQIKLSDGSTLMKSGDVTVVYP